MNMEFNSIAALAGLVGSMTGATATIGAAWVTQRVRNKSQMLESEIAKREALYGQFIAECARLLVDAFGHSLDKPDTLLPLYALVNRIRLCATPPVLEEAERLLARVTEQYFSENLTVEQMRELTRTQRDDPMRAFGEACRAEFGAIQARI